MTPEEIIEAYDVLANDVRDYTAQQAQAIGNSQRSIGGLAEVVANPSGQTSGLANYTYNRLLRPTVNTLSTALETQGRSQGMDRYLKDELMKAKAAYEDAKNSYTVAATTPKTTSGGGGSKEVTDDGYEVTKSPYIEEGTYTGTGSAGPEGGLKQYDVSFADGNGGVYVKHVMANSREEAKNKATVVGVGSSGNGVYDLIFADGSRKQYFANSPEEAKRKYYKDNNSW